VNVYRIERSPQTAALSYCAVVIGNTTHGQVLYQWANQSGFFPPSTP